MGIAGEIVLPQELMLFHASLQTAMAKAFGKMVISSSDQIAAKVLDKFGLSSITLQGTVCQRGSMQASRSCSNA